MLHVRCSACGIQNTVSSYVVKMLQNSDADSVASTPDISADVEDHSSSPTHFITPRVPHHVLARKLALIQQVGTILIAMTLSQQNGSSISLLKANVPDKSSQDKGLY